jgi:hypothetical protein
MLTGIEYSELDSVCQRLIMPIILKVHNFSDNFTIKNKDKRREEVMVD